MPARHTPGSHIINNVTSVVKTLGFNRTITLVLTCPPFLFAGAAGIMTGWSSGRLHERTWHITAGLSVAIVGFVIAASTMNTAGRYIACFIFPVGAYSVNSVIIGWASSTLSQTKEKKAVVLAMTNVGGQVGTFSLLPPHMLILYRSGTSTVRTCGQTRIRRVLALGSARLQALRC